MPFPFTFALSVPGLANPFNSSPAPVAGIIGKARPGTSEPTLTSEFQHHPTRAGSDSINLTKHEERRFPSPTPSFTSFRAPAPNRKRKQWEPIVGSASTTAHASVSAAGYLDTPAKYAEMAGSVEKEDREREDEPPNKRRRTSLAGSIASTAVSTAVSAAIIGTAVGLTMYRLWRDRGIETPQPPPPPPPPYQQGEWIPVQSEQVQPEPTTPMSPKRPRKPRPAAAKRTPVKHTARRARTTAQGPIGPRFSQPQFDFGKPEVEAEDDTDTQMDWIGGKLAELIQQGQKALGKEIVVATDAYEDEPDDDETAWVEDTPFDPEGSIPRPSRSRSNLRAGRLCVQNNTSSSHSAAVSPVGSVRNGGILMQNFNGRGESTEGDVTAVGHSGSSFKEDESAWESQQLKDTMARARARYLAGRS